MPHILDVWPPVDSLFGLAFWTAVLFLLAGLNEVVSAFHRIHRIRTRGASRRSTGRRSPFWYGSVERGASAVRDPENGPGTGPGSGSGSGPGSGPGPGSGFGSGPGHVSERQSGTDADFCNSFADSVLHMLRLSLFYLLMSAFMLGNFWLNLASVSGTAVGYFLFGHWYDVY